MKKGQKYNIGLDIGTESVGWAVTDPNTNKILRIGKKKLWGVRLFEEGQSAAGRRNFRSTRRRYDRRRQRIFYLQNIFYDEINKIDNSFFIRLKDGFLRPEDKTINKENSNKTKKFKYNLFIDKNFNDNDYYKKYPTIYHLRYDLMKNPCNDIRLIYLAMHHIVKYRGNFLQEGKNIDVSNININEKLESIFKDIKYNYEDISVSDYELDYNYLKTTLTDKRLRKSEKQKQISKELTNYILDKNSSKNIANLMVGIKANLLDIFPCEVQDSEQEKKCKISFEDSDYDEKISDLETVLGKNIDLINEFKQLYDEVYLSNIFKDAKEPTLSYVMIEKYNKHKKDKIMLKKYLTEDDKKEFFSKEGIYHEYTKQPKNCPYDKLSSELKRILNNYENTEIKEQILLDIENNNFLPKVTDTSNGVYPYQLNLTELNKIIQTQSINYPFLAEKITEEDGKQIYKISKLLTFRIPYYVGPLNRNPNQKDTKAWIVKKTNEKITPFNFDKVVDKISSANEFIVRMTSNCTYIYDEKAMPANSLLYSKYKVLNELKQIKINGRRIDKSLEKDVINDLFFKYPKVTDKILKNYLIEIKYPGSNNIMDITGYSADKYFANNLKPYLDFIKIFGKDYVLNNENVIENLIEWITIFEDKKILKEKIKLEYPKFNEDLLNKICNLKYKGWSALSKKLLTEIYYKDDISNENYNIIDLLEQTDDNFMQILFNKKYKFQDKINELNFSNDINDITIEDVQELTTSPANKRAIWQTVKIIKELIDIIGHNPEHIYIEMARGDGVKQRTSSREKQLINLYDKCKNDIANYNRLCDEIKGNKKLDIDKYFLYYLQQGKCLYTGKDINLSQLNECEIDHIIPRSLIKDDSLDNKALVFRQENQDKGDNNILLERVRNPEVKTFWQQLKKNNFITEKKYNNLMRNEFREKDIEGFINRQLVETRQITKHVAGLLNNLYDSNKNVGSEDTVVQFINANISHNYREKYELYKYRQINNYHHAHDAYLAAVLGNYKTLLFKNVNMKEFIIEYKEKIKNRNIEDNNRCYGIIIDSIENNIFNSNTGEIIFDANEFKETVCNNMYNQDILITRKNEIYTGEFYNQTLYKKGIGKIEIKKGLDPNKYGGYNSVNSSYMVLVKYTNKQKEMQKLIGIPIMYTVGKDSKNLIDSYIKKTLDCDNYKIIKNKIPFKSLIKFEENLFYISGYSISHKDFEMINGIELKLPKNILINYKQLLNFICNDKYPNYKICSKDIIKQYNLNIKENNINYWDNIFNSQINDLFDKLLVIMKKNYNNFCGKTISKLLLVKDSNEFYNLSLHDNEFNKKEIILQLLNLLSTNSRTANLSKLKKTISFSDSEGRTRKSINGRIIFYNKSVTGLKEDKNEL